MLSEAQRKDLLQEVTELREHLRQLSLQVVQMFQLMEEVLEELVPEKD